MCVCVSVYVSVCVCVCVCVWVGGCIYYVQEHNIICSFYSIPQGTYKEGKLVEQSHYLWNHLHCVAQCRESY